MASDNSTTPAPSTAFGFKISKPTYNALYTSGKNYTFNSSWPSLQIAYQITIKSLSSYTFTYPYYIIPHNLGFPPFTFWWAVDTSSNGISNGYVKNIASVDSTNVYLDTTQMPNDFISTPVNIKCFNLDLTKDIDYTYLNGDFTTTVYDPNFGMKISKVGKSTSSIDLRDYTVHSRALSPLVLAVKTQKTLTNTVNVDGSYTIQFTSKLNYPTWVYGFVGNTSSKLYQFAPLYSQAYPRTFTDGFVSSLAYGPTGSTDNAATLIILRDPMFAPTTVDVQY